MQRIKHKPAGECVIEIEAELKSWEDLAARNALWGIEFSEDAKGSVKKLKHLLAEWRTVDLETLVSIDR